MTALDKILKSIDRMRPLSRAAEGAIKTMRDPNVSMAKVVDILKYDPAITASVIRYCNSPLAGIHTRVNSLQQAVVLIGMERLRSMVLTAALEQYFPGKPDGYETRRYELWKHSLAVGLISEDLSGMVGQIQRDEAFTAGLLHDIGKVLLSQFMEGEWRRIEELIDRQDTDFLAVEREIFGIDHMEVGGRILERWNFSPEIRDAARLHHYAPAPGEPLCLAHLVHMADIAAILAGWNTGVDGLHYHGKQDVFRNFGISFSDFQRMMSRMADKVALIEREHFGEEKRR